MSRQLLSDQALTFYAQTDTTCLAQFSQPDSFGGMAPPELLRDGADLNPLFAVLGKENPAITTTKPILLLQGSADTTVFPVFTDQLNQELLALGNTVTTRPTRT